MKIITWNCNMAFRKKAAAILAEKPDILVIVECEHPDKMIFPEGTPIPTDKLWFGSNQHKGIAVFSYGPYCFKKHRKHNNDFKLIIPVKVTGGKIDFNLFLVWAHNPDDKDGRYVTQVWKAVNFYSRMFRRKPTILIGDFNSNTIWDKEKNRLGSHSAVVKQLQQKGISSVYHLHHQQLQGAEAHPTFYLYRHKDKPYHLDYCFASDSLLPSLEYVSVGGHAKWSKLSDHMPLMVKFNLNDLTFPGKKV